MTSSQLLSLSKITPGPWKFEQGRDADDFAVTEPSGNTLCEPNQPLFADYTGLDEAIRKIPLEEARANGIAMSLLPDLLAERTEMIEMLKLAKSHIAELREAWQRGVFTEHDGKGGTRSNRNADVDSALWKILDRAENGS